MQYSRHFRLTITKRDGGGISGCVSEETDDKLVLIVNPMTNQREEIAQKDIPSRVVAKFLTMPEGSPSVRTRDEILDLPGFVESDVKQTNGVFTARR